MRSWPGRCSRLGGGCGIYEIEERRAYIVLGGWEARLWLRTQVVCIRGCYYICSLRLCISHRMG